MSVIICSTLKQVNKTFSITIPLGLPINRQGFDSVVI